MSKENTMPLEKLFGSKTRAKLLALFFENPDKSYYVREITRVIEEQINSVRRELTNLNALGLVKTAHLYYVDVLFELLLYLVYRPLVSRRRDGHAGYLMVVGLAYSQSVDIEAASCEES